MKISGNESRPVPEKPATYRLDYFRARVVILKGRSGQHSVIIRYHTFRDWDMIY
jgi:hypothetical protein